MVVHEHNSDRLGAADPRYMPGQVVEEVDRVEVVDECVGQSDEHGGELVGGDHGWSFTSPVPIRLRTVLVSVLGQPVAMLDDVMRDRAEVATCPEGVRLEGGKAVGQAQAESHRHHHLGLIDLGAEGHGLVQGRSDLRGGSVGEASMLTPGGTAVRGRLRERLVRLASTTVSGIAGPGETMAS